MLHLALQDAKLVCATVGTNPRSYPYVTEARGCSALFAWPASTTAAYLHLHCGLLPQKERMRPLADSHCLCLEKLLGALASPGVGSSLCICCCALAFLHTACPVEAKHCQLPPLPSPDAPPIRPWYSTVAACVVQYCPGGCKLSAKLC